jgi:hypothetical protein
MVSFWSCGRKLRKAGKCIATRSAAITSNI